MAEPIQELSTRLNTSSGWIGTWSPAIGDPTFIGWLIAVLYLAAAFMCGRVVRKRTQVQRRSARVWLVLTYVLATLGVNKQLDIQTALIEVGRVFAGQGFAYDLRYELAYLFASLVALGALVGFFTLIRRIGALPRHDSLALGGLGLILTYTLLRILSIGGLSRAFQFPFSGDNRGWAIELSGILIVVFSAHAEIRKVENSKRDKIMKTRASSKQSFKS